jgi:peptidoglycan/LPS O-acetylase OafA/YrhL
MSQGETSTVAPPVLRSTLPFMPALTGIRAIAVGMVFLVHAFPGLGFPGGLGVDVFFVISGFLITLILMKEHRKTGTVNLKRFYINRLIRLYPALLLMVAVFLIAFPLVRISFLNDAIQSSIAVTYMSNIYMTVTDNSLGHLKHTWSLAMEEQFYFVWPLLLLVALRFRVGMKWIVAGVAILAAASLIGWYYTGEESPFNPITKAGGLLIGCLTALVVSTRPWHDARLALVSAALFIFAIVGETVGWFGRELSMPLATLAMPGILLHLAYGHGRMVRLLSGKMLVYLGVISYGLYLWHYPILYVLRMFNGLPESMIAIIALVLTVAIAALSDRLIERPAKRLRGRLGTR